MKEGTTSDPVEGDDKQRSEPEASDSVGSSAEQAKELEAEMEESGKENAA
jgi:hypothetical protein